MLNGYETGILCLNEFFGGPGNENRSTVGYPAISTSRAPKRVPTYYYIIMLRGGVYTFVNEIPNEKYAPEKCPPRPATVCARHRKNSPRFGGTGFRRWFDNNRTRRPYGGHIRGYQKNSDLPFSCARRCYAHTKVDVGRGHWSHYILYCAQILFSFLVVWLNCITVTGVLHHYYTP